MRILLWHVADPVPGCSGYAGDCGPGWNLGRTLELTVPVVKLSTTSGANHNLPLGNFHLKWACCRTFAARFPEYLQHKMNRYT